MEIIPKLVSVIVRLLPKGDTVTKICMKIAFWKVIPGNTREEVRKVNKEGRKVDEIHG